jgi:hypothetical protein
MRMVRRNLWSLEPAVNGRAGKSRGHGLTRGLGPGRVVSTTRMRQASCRASGRFGLEVSDVDRALGAYRRLRLEDAHGVSAKQYQAP